MPAHAPVQVNDANFADEVLASDQPVLVQFWASWCDPCRRAAPAVEGVAADYGARLRVRRVDVDENARMTARYGIRAVPTFLVFRGGQVVERLQGAVPRAQLEALVAKLV